LAKSLTRSYRHISITDGVRPDLVRIGRSALDVERWTFSLPLPLYTMVTFTRIPYAEAARRARRQDRIVYAGLIFFSIALIVVLSILLSKLINE
jgi:hypothetical protein